MTAPIANTTAVALRGAVSRLTDVLEQENRALMAGDPDAVRQLGEQKRAACRSYEEAVRALAADPALASGAPAERARAELRAASARLALAAAENERRLAATIAAHKRLLDLVGLAMVSLDPNAGIYASTGAAARGRGGAGVVPTPALSFDRAL